MLRKRLGSGLLVGAAVAGAAGLFLQCAPSEDTSVAVISACDVNSLNVADPAEATVKLYAQTSGDLTARVNDLLGQFTTVCNAINRDLGAQEGAEVHEACNRIADRILAANAIAPQPAGAAREIWVSITYDTTCDLNGASAAECLAQCSDQKNCDPVAACAAGSKRGTCSAECTACATEGSPTACKGACNGECAMPAGTPNLPACQGECRGTCSAPSWRGTCSTGCQGNGFRGLCKGTCVGTCDATGLPGATLDGGADGGPTPGSGTCAGICVGSCNDGEATGNCAGTTPASACKGEFYGGQCLAPGVCTGACVAVGTPCVTECKGTCTAPGATCAGSCVGECKGELGNPSCAAAPACQANPICAGVCALRGAIATACKPSAIDIRVGADAQLPIALRNHAADFSKLAREANLLSTNLGAVVQRTPAEFKAIGVVRDNARLCAESAPAAYEELRKRVNEAVGASLVLTGAKF